MTRQQTIEEYYAPWGPEEGFRRQQRAEQRAVRRAALLAHYGSAEAGWAPCERETLLLRAVAGWRKPQKPPYERWTDTLDGYPGARELTDQVRQAIAEAYPLPVTFAEARAEHDYWERRRQDMRDLYDDELAEEIPDTLDSVAQGRANMVRVLAMAELPTTTLADLHARFAMLRASPEVGERETEAALFRDLTAIMQQDAAPSRRADEMTRSEPHGHIVDALRSDPSRSDRDIARALECSPTTVGKVRKDLGFPPSIHAAQQQGAAA